MAGSDVTSYSKYERHPVFSKTWILVSTSLFLLAIFQLPGKSRDWFAYDIFFTGLRADAVMEIASSRFEPAFIVISTLLVNLLATNIYVYGCIVFFSILIKCLALNKLSVSKNLFLFTIIFYLLRFAALHELTQIRIGCSVSFLYLGFVFACFSKPKMCLLACLGALAFHMSTVVILPFVLLTFYPRFIIFIKSLKNVLFISACIFVTVLLLTKFFVNTLDDLSTAVSIYQAEGFGDDKVNPFGILLILDWVMIFCGIFNWRRLTTVMKYIIFLQLVGMAFFYATMSYEVVAERVRDIFSVFWTFFVYEGLRYKNIMRSYTFLFLWTCSLFYGYIYFIRPGFFL